ncbi:hypothetical protein [Lentzea sp. NBRC 105346]|uniref:hypothetical protein n=1 Tax=Lentzea sp. NBRC 105346 TaxID=3032205 RepID=UPI002556C2F8|nr:hypothetical protein [Lentzea sp. NBRC 105346]
MTEDDLLEKYGLRPTGAQLDEVRGILTREMREPEPDVGLMKLCCVQLFLNGSLEDAPLIWEAKESGWDAHCSIDVQLLCGAGLEATLAHLEGEALDYLKLCVESGDFEDFSVSRQAEWYAEYYEE